MGGGLVGEGGKENVVKLQITVSAVTRFDRRSSAHAGGIPYLYFCRATREFCIWLEPQVAEGIADRVSDTEMWTPRDRTVSKTICPYPSAKWEDREESSEARGNDILTPAPCHHRRRLRV